MDGSPSNPFLKSLDDFKSKKKVEPVVKSASAQIDIFDEEPKKKMTVVSLWWQRLLQFLHLKMA